MSSNSSAIGFSRVPGSFHASDALEGASDPDTTLLDSFGVTDPHSHHHNHHHHADVFSDTTTLYHDDNIATVFTDSISHLDDDIFLTPHSNHAVEDLFTPVDHQAEALGDPDAQSHPHNQDGLPYVQEFSREWMPDEDEFDDYEYQMEQEDHQPEYRSYDMSSMPTDINTLHAVQDIIGRQFDVEIANRNRELQVIEHRITQGEWLLEQLEQAWANRGWTVSPLPPDGSSPSSVPALSISAAAAAFTSGAKRKKDKKRSKRSKRAKKKKTKPSIPSYSVFSRRSDGTFVQLICPRCRRSRFKDQLGFVNHCRIMHKLKFSSYEEAALQCGIPVDESDVPADDPSRLKGSDGSRGTASAGGGGGVGAPDTTRFYVKKRINVGNTSKLLPVTDGSRGKATHEWTIFIIGPDEDPDLVRYVSKVVFFLHPDFKPNHVVEVDSPPFRLTRTGWGEFPVRVQLHFVDRRNRPKDIVHALKLDKSNTLDDIIVSETPATLDLDRRFFSDAELYGVPDSPPTLTIATLDFGGGYDGGFGSGGAIPCPQVDEDTFHEYLLAAVRRYPLVSTRHQRSELPYSFAKSEEEWNAWNLGKRRSSEFQRARLMRRYLVSKLGHDKPTKHVLHWCRENGHVPEKHFRKKYYRKALSNTRLREASRKAEALMVPPQDKPGNEVVVEQLEAGTLPYQHQHLQQQQYHHHHHEGLALAGHSQLDAASSLMIDDESSFLFDDTYSFLDDASFATLDGEMEVVDMIGSVVMDSPAKSLLATPPPSDPAFGPPFGDGSAAPIPAVKYDGQDAEEYHSSRPEVMLWVRDVMEDVIDFPYASSTKYSRVVEAFLFKAACNFTSSLVRRSLEHAKSQVIPPGGETMFDPSHVVQAAGALETFDFLTNKGMQDVEYEGDQA